MGCVLGYSQFVEDPRIIWDGDKILSSSKSFASNVMSGDVGGILHIPLTSFSRVNPDLELPIDRRDRAAAAVHSVRDLGKCHVAFTQ